MRNKNNFEMKKADYSNLKTKILIQTTCCIAILISILLFKFFSENLIEQVNYYLHHHTDWQIVYDTLFKAKDTILHYIR